MMRRATGSLRNLMMPEIKLPLDFRRQTAASTSFQSIWLMVRKEASASFIRTNEPILVILTVDAECCAHSLGYLHQVSRIQHLRSSDDVAPSILRRLCSRRRVSLDCATYCQRLRYHRLGTQSAGRTRRTSDGWRGRGGARVPRCHLKERTTRAYSQANRKQIGNPSRRARF